MSIASTAPSPSVDRIDAPHTRIYPYEPPLSLAANLWQVRGSLRIPGLPRNMTIYRLPDGHLVLYSVIAMHEDGMRALEALGTPAIMVIPHDRHQMDAPFYKSRYPSLRVLAPCPEKPRRVPIDSGLYELGALGIGSSTLPGTSYDEAILELPVEGGVALCTCELLGNLSPPPTGLVGLAAKVFGPPGGGFGVNRAVRWREVASRASVREWLDSLAARRDIRMITMAHGAPVLGDVSAALARAARGA
jgi:hypothetical protein